MSFTRLGLQTVRRSAAGRSALNTQKRFSSHGVHYHEPSGHLFGEKLEPGQTRVKKPYENIVIFTYVFGIALVVAMKTFNGKESLSDWAEKEARRRLVAEGILKEEE